MEADQDLSFVSLQRDFWDSPWQNRHAFLWELADHHPVLFQSPPFYLADLVQRKISRTKMRSGLHPVKPGLLAHVPPRYLPYNFRFPRLDRIVARLREAGNRRIARRHGFQKPVLLVWHPDFADQIGKHDERLVVYYKYDHYAGYYSDGGSDQTEATAAEKRLLGQADHIFVTSQGLYDMHTEYASKLHLLPNGVDYPLFAGVAADVTNPVPKELAAIPHPRIGYVGVINEKVDFRLLTSLCRIRPEWSIVLIGPDKTRLPEHLADRDELKRQPNVFFLGPQDGRAVPRYLKGLDLCMMCYLVNDWTYYGYPLKMHEYLAVGKPVVAADLPAIREFAHVIPIATGTDAWLRAIAAGLSGADNITPAARQQAARANSWQQRVRDFLRILGQNGHSSQRAGGI